MSEREKKVLELELEARNQEKFMPRDNRTGGPPFRPQQPYPDADRIRWEPLYLPEPSAPSTDRRQARRGAIWKAATILLLVIALGIAIAFFREISGFLGTIGKLGDHPTEKETFSGFVAFGLILVTIVAVVKIVVEGQRRG